MNFSPIERTLVALLIDGGPIRGTAQVGYALWPDRSMQPQGAALAAGKVIRRLHDTGAIERHVDATLARYEVTAIGRAWLAADLLESVDVRQLSLLKED
jgi:hypothetical protein